MAQEMLVIGHIKFTIALLSSIFPSDKDPLRNNRLFAETNIGDHIGINLLRNVSCTLISR